MYVAGLEEETGKYDANSYIASTNYSSSRGKPVFADVLPDQNIDPSAIQRLITKKTKAIMAVHLTGRSCIWII